MTPIEIAYFKHFLFDKSLERDFQYFYRTRRIKGSPSGDKGGNPESIEEYFMKTSRQDVIMKAFYFAPTNNNAQRLTVTYDYWKDIDDKWQEYMRQNEMNFSNDSWPKLRKSFAILRQNWDVPYYWRHENLESTEEVYERMHIDLPLPEFRWEHGYTKREERPDSNLIDYDIHNAKDGDFVVRTRTLKGGGIGRTIFIMKEVVPYDPETSEFTPEQLHCDYDPEKGNVYIAYLHARYNSMGGSFSTDYADDLHAVIDDSSTSEKYRMAFKEEEQQMILKLAENQFAWNPDTKTVVPLLEALEAMNGKPAEKVNPRFKVGDTIKGTISGDVATIIEVTPKGYFTDDDGFIDIERQDMWEPLPKDDIPLLNFSDNEDDDPLAGFEFIDNVQPTNYKLKPGEASINFYKSNKITFNQFDSVDIVASGLKFARLASNKAGDICLVLNNVKGANISKGKMKNATINSIDICSKIKTLFSLKEKYSILNVELLQKTQEFIIYKITKDEN